MKVVTTSGLLLETCGMHVSLFLSVSTVIIIMYTRIGIYKSIYKKQQQDFTVHSNL